MCLWAHDPWSQWEADVCQETNSIVDKMRWQWLRCLRDLALKVMSTNTYLVVVVQTLLSIHTGARESNGPGYEQTRYA